MNGIIRNFVWGTALFAASGMGTASAAQAAPATKLGYTLTDLGVVGPPPGQAFVVAGDGLVSGSQATRQSKEHAFLWFQGFKLDIGKYALGGGNSVGFAVNSWGQVTGQADTATIDPLGEDFCGFNALGFPGGHTCAAFLWQDGRMTGLPALGGNNSAANYINDRGVIGGQAETALHDANCPAPQILQFKPTLWRNGQAHALPTHGSDRDGVVLAVNNQGVAVGASGDCAAYNTLSFYGIQPLHALLWENGMAHDMGNLGGTGHGTGNIAFHVNEGGQAVGVSDLPGDMLFHAFSWTKGKGIEDLGTLPGDVASVGLSNNDRGQIVGVSLDENFNSRAFLLENGTMTDLNTLVPANAALSLWTASSINARGQIVGLAQDKKTGAFHGYLVSPRQCQPGK
jgi:probable HAF family extracellular repeat protein